MEGAQPSSMTEVIETPKRSKKFLFLLLFLFPKREKVTINNLTA